VWMAAVGRVRLNQSGSQHRSQRNDSLWSLRRPAILERLGPGDGVPRTPGGVTGRVAKRAQRPGWAMRKVIPRVSAAPLGTGCHRNE
jgi:hypothetical protein